MKRRLLTLAAAVSLLLCVATLALWVRSYWAYDRIERFNKVGSMYLSSHTGAMGFVRDPVWSGAARGIYYTKVQSGSPFGGALTFRAHVRYRNQLRIIIPHWFLALVFAILPTLYLGAVMRARRHSRAGRCPTCGYDLRATPDRCPECGAVPAATARAVACVPP